MKWSEHKKELLKNPELSKELERTRPEYEVARALILVRIKYNLTQSQLAKKLNTKQSVISRVETAQTTPTLSFINRFAQAFGATLKISFEGL
jgi:transcriptional regulator with XRE-family HTH domain